MFGSQGINLAHRFYFSVSNKDKVTRNRFGITKMMRNHQHGNSALRSQFLPSSASLHATPDQAPRKAHPTATWDEAEQNNALRQHADAALQKGAQANGRGTLQHQLAAQLVQPDVLVYREL